MFFMNRNAKRGKGKSKISMSANIFRMPDSPPSPASFTSTEVIEILPKPTTGSTLASRSLTPSSVSEREASFQSSRSDFSPRLGLNFAHESFATSFSSEVLGANAIASRRRGSEASAAPGRSRMDMLGRNHSALAGSSLTVAASSPSRDLRYESSIASSSSPNLPQTRVHHGASSSLSEVDGYRRAAGATSSVSLTQSGVSRRNGQTSSYVNLSSESSPDRPAAEESHSEDLPDTVVTHAIRRPAPAPLTIPTEGLSRKRPIEIARSAEEKPAEALPPTEGSGSQQFLRTGASTPDSYESNSAVSGITLAVALGNAFNFGGSARESMRSTVSRSRSTVTRMDSAILPRGDNPFALSPYGSFAGAIPPVPPLPSSARGNSKRRSKRASALSQDGRENSRRSLKRRSSTSSIVSNRSLDRPKSFKRTSSTFAPALSAHSEVFGDIGDSAAKRRISRISEADSPGPSQTNTPGHPATTPRTANSQATDDSGSHYTASSAPLSLQRGSPPQVKNGRKHPYAAGVPSAAASADDIYSILNEYQFVSPSGTPMSAYSFGSKKSKLSQSTTSRVTTAPGKVKGRGGSILAPAVSPPKTQLPSLPVDALSSAASVTGHFPQSAGSESSQSLYAAAELVESAPDMPLSPDAYDRMVQPQLDESGSSFRSVFTKTRAGAVPNPITVVRDSYNNAYSITLAGNDDPGSSGVSTGGVSKIGTVSGSVRQCFPETPDVFSPMWSAGVPPSSGGVPSMILFGAGANGEPGVTLAGPEGDLVIPAPLMRSASSAGPAALATLRAKLSGQALGRSATLSRAPSVDSLIPQMSGLSPISSPLSAQDTQAADILSPIKELSTPPLEQEHPEIIAPKAVDASESNSLRRLSGLPPATRLEADNHAQSRSSSPMSSSNPIRPLPTPASSEPPSRRASPMPSLSILEAAPRDGTQTSLKPLPVPSSRPTSSTQPIRPLPSKSPKKQDSRPPLVNPPSPPDSLLFDDISVARASFVAPPAYHIAVNELPQGSTHLQDSVDRAPNFGTPSSFTASLPRRPSDTSSFPETPELLNGGSNSISRRTRTRAPAGPRRPSTASVAPSLTRHRNASVSSIHSNSSTTGPSPHTANSTHTSSSGNHSPNPRFQSTPIGWRGFTLDVAKWTFSSQQLQGIVSRAIRQSAEASSLRLVPLDILDNEVPQEASRLEMRSSELKLEYKQLAHKRGALQSALAAHVDGSAVLDHKILGQTLTELSDTTSTLDAVSDELYVVTDQLMQLHRLRDVHAYSALAMALRKLNASFLKQVTENQEMRQNLAIAEAERDDAWDNVQELTTELEAMKDIQSKMQEELSRNQSQTAEDALDPGPSISARSSRLPPARRKSTRIPPSLPCSRRASSVRRSVRSSTGSYGPIYSSIKSAFSDAPPVPPIPRRNLAIRTSDIQSRASYASSNTPATDVEAMAMAQAQRELYTMLGISPTSEANRSKDGLPLSHSRRHSLSASSPVTRPSSFNGNHHRPASALSMRAASLPSTPGNLGKFYDALDDDRQAMLATLNLIQ